MVSGGLEGANGVDLLGIPRMMLDCIDLFSVYLFIIIFYIEDNVRFRCGRKAT